MVQPFPRFFILLLVVSCCATLAEADLVPIGVLSFDANTAYALAAFDISNYTDGTLAPDFPITTQLTFTVTSLVADIQGGGTLTLDGSFFGGVGAQGDVDCIVAGDAGSLTSKGCDFAAYSLVSATLTGTLSPTTGLGGLPAGDTGIAGAFTTTITPNVGCGLSGGTSSTLTAGCDSAIINANGTSPVPEPSSRTVLAVALMGLLLVGSKLRGPTTKLLR
jgi:hypothetical protein